MGSLYTRSKDTKREPQIWHYFRNGGLGPAVPQQKAISGSAPQVSDASQHKFNWSQTYMLSSILWLLNSPQLCVY